MTEGCGSRQRSPPRKEETEEEASAWRSKNLGENFSQHADQAENQGIAESSQMVRHEKQGIEELDDDTVPLEVVDKRKSDPIEADTEVGKLNENDEEKGVVNKLISEEVGSDGDILELNLEMPQVDQGARLNGHYGPKQKSTWTRIMRMDYGLGSFTTAIEGPILGKRVSEQYSNLSLSHAEEVQKVKHGKLSSTLEDGSARVDDHPCREQ